MEKVIAGKYLAKLLDYGIGETKGGAAQVMALFEYNDFDGHRHEMTWFGTLKEGKGQEITLKALLTLGMKDNDLNTLVDGVLGNALDVNTPVQIDIQMEPDQNGTGSHARIKWINRVGGSAFQKKLSKDEAKGKLASLNLKGAMMALRTETGIKEQPKQTTFAEDVGF